jgi:hypothetical protein
MSHFDAVFNLGLKATRRLQSAHKPLVRLMRRSARAEEHRAFRQDAEEIDRQIAACASGRGPIVVGPWLAEVGYEVLYWIPFVRWFQDAFGIQPQRLVVVSRGGMESAYGELAGSYVDLLDLSSAEALATRNAERRSDVERGGQKQSGLSQYDTEIVTAVRARVGIGEAAVLHPSLMFRLFRHVWYDNLPFDVLWRHTRYVTADRGATMSLTASSVALPDDFIAVKVYGGPALGTGDATRGLVRDLVAHAAAVAPVVVLEAEHGLDEHRDFDFDGLPGVTSAKTLMAPRTNLGVQLALVARSRYFLSACGGLAWLAPFLGVPTVALYEQDRLLAPHLFVARQAGARAGAAEFTPLDLRGLGRLDLGRRSSWPA